MKRICDICGVVDELPRHVIACSPAETPPVNQAMLNTIMKDDTLTPDERTSIVMDLQDNTLMLRHLDDFDGVCTPFTPPEESE